CSSRFRQTHSQGALVQVDYGSRAATTFRQRTGGRAMKTRRIRMTNGALAATRPPHPWVTAGRTSIRFGVVSLADVADWPAYLRTARMAEDLGFDSFWSPDHPMGGRDCWTTLGAVAAATARIRLGSAASCVSFRHPAVLARAAADVDRISQGRLILGVGIGD